MSQTTPKYRHPKFNQLILHKRKSSKYWQCGFHHNGKYHRTSTRELTRSDAELVAEEWYFNLQAKIRTGKTPNKIKRNILTVNKASIHAMNELRMNIENGENTQKYMDGVVDYLNTHILPYFGDMACEDVSSADWKQFTNDLTNKKISENKTLARSTLHQARNALNKCLKFALDVEAIQQIPKFSIKAQSNKSKMIRVYFTKTEQEILLDALEKNIDLQTTDLRKLDALELKDFVEFMLFSGLRMDEIPQVKFCDLQDKTNENGESYLMIYNIAGKVTLRGTCKPDLKIRQVVERLKNRIKPVLGDEFIFTKRYRQRKDMFNDVLKSCELKVGADGRKRDFISLRHTYICNKIIEGVPVQDIATNCRNSVQVINSNYAKYLDAELLNAVHNVERAEIKELANSIAKERLNNKKEYDDSLKKAKRRAEIIKSQFSKMQHLNPEDVSVRKLAVRKVDNEFIDVTHELADEANKSRLDIIKKYGISNEELEVLIGTPDIGFYASTEDDSVEIKLEINPTPNNTNVQ